jgi:hypothetical protein
MKIPHNHRESITDMRQETWSAESRQFQNMEMKRQNVNYSSEAFGNFATLEVSN